jgi:Family of unknown function (DUF5719)
MSARRLSIVLVLVAGLVAIGVLGRDRPVAVDAVFASFAEPTTPYVPLDSARLTSTYYCPGAIVAGDTRSADVVIANPTDAPVQGQLTMFDESGSALAVPLEIGPRSRQIVSLDAATTVDEVGAIVELERTGIVVEQRSVGPAGTALAACANDASRSWYFADGATVDGNSYDLLLTNPYPDAAVVDLTFVTQAGTQEPTKFQGFVIPPQSTRRIDVAGEAARDEAQLAISVESRRGRVVAAKIQNIAGPVAGHGRLGYVNALGAPSVSDRWFFADGEVGDGISELYTIYNPTDEPVDVDVLFAPVPAGTALVEPVSLTIGAQESLVLDAASVPNLPAGRHVVDVRTFSDAAIVVERALTRPADDSVATTVVLGSRFGSPRWWVPTGVAEAADAALVVRNLTNLEGTVTVFELGPGGILAVPGLVDLLIAPGEVATIDLTAAQAIDTPLLVESDTLQILVEQRFPRGPEQPGRGGALAIPE